MKNFQIILLFALFCNSAFSQNYRVVNGQNLTENYSRKPHEYLGENENTFYVIENRSEYKISLSMKMNVCIRTFDKVTLKPRASFIADGIYLNNLKNENCFIRANLVGENVAIVYNDAKEGAVKILWLSAETLKIESTQSTKFKYGADAIFRDPYDLNYRSYNAKKEIVYDVRCASYNNGKAFSISVIESFPNKPVQLKSMIIGSGKEIITESQQAIKTELMQSGYKIKTAMTEQGDLGVLIMLSDVKRTSYIDLKPGFYYTTLKFNGEQQDFSAIALNESFDGHIRLKARKDVIYIGGVGNFFYAQKVLVGELRTDVSACKMVVTEFPAEAHAQMENLKKYDKNLEKARKGKSLMGHHLEFTGMDVTEEGNIILSMSEYKMTQSRDELTGTVASTNYTYGNTLVVSVQTSGSFNWTRVLQRKFNTQLYSSYQAHMQKAIAVGNDVYFFINDGGKKMEGLDLSMAESTGGEINLVVIKPDGSWKLEGLDLAGSFKKYKVLGLTPIALENGNIVVGTSQFNKSQINYIMLQFQ